MEMYGIVEYIGAAPVVVWTDTSRFTAVPAAIQRGALIRRRTAKRGGRVTAQLKNFAKKTAAAKQNYPFRSRGPRYPLFERLPNSSPADSPAGVSPFSWAYRRTSKNNTAITAYEGQPPRSFAIASGSFLILARAFKTKARNTEKNPAANVTMRQISPRLGPDFWSGTSAISRI